MDDWFLFLYIALVKQWDVPKEFWESIIKVQLSPTSNQKGHVDIKAPV